MRYSNNVGQELIKAVVLTKKKEIFYRDMFEAVLMTNSFYFLVKNECGFVHVPHR